jgi:hypothetical protein
MLSNEVAAMQQHLSFHILGVLSVCSVWGFAARLIWEQTVWTWAHGAQMIGFQLLHGGGILLVISVLLSLFWPAAALRATVTRTSPGSTATRVLLAAYVSGFLLLFVPYGFWIRTFIYKFSPEQSVALMIYASADGDATTVKAFLRRGVDVNASQGGSNALQAAAIQGRIDMMELLVASGADIKSVNMGFEETRRSVLRLNERMK